VRKTFAIAALAAITVASSLLAFTDEAAAQQRRWTRAFGIGIGAGVIAGATVASVPVYVEAKCAWVDQYDREGNFLGRVRVCDTTPY
jgi:hypothetical protein